MAEQRSFANPILPGFYPDPSICRVGDDYYLVTSSFEYFPGVPIFHSRDLVNYRLLGHALTRSSQLDLRGAPSSGGIYAPTLRHHDGLFYMVTTHIGRGNFYVTAERPAGPWSDPIWLDEDGIDPSFAFFDGTAYYTRNGKGADFDHPLIYQGTLDLKTGKLGAPPRPIWSGTGGIWPEAPHLYEFCGAYYLFHAEGGTGYDHSEIAVRGRSPFGPFEACPDGPILGHRERTEHPIQATGHADVVELPDGSTWAVFLAIRPKNGRHHHLGRETFLAPVTWSKDGWPVIGNRGHVELEMPAPSLSPAPFAAPPARDDFDARTLEPSWIFLRNPDPADSSLDARPGFLRLTGSALTLDDIASPALVLRRQQHFAVRCRTRLEFDPKSRHEEAGLVVRANENFYYTLAVRRGTAGREVVLNARIDGTTVLVNSAPLPDGPVELELAADTERYAFSATSGGGSVALGSLSTTELSAENIWRSTKKHYFTGACFGLYATGSGQRADTPAEFDWFEYVPAGD